MSNITKFELDKLVEAKAKEIEVPVTLNNYVTFTKCLRIMANGYLTYKLPFNINITTHSKSLSDFLAGYADKHNVKGYKWENGTRLFFPSYLREIMPYWFRKSVKIGRAVTVYDLDRLSKKDKVEDKASI